MHSINKQEYKEAIQTIERVKDVEVSFQLALKFGLVLSKQEPEVYLRLVSKLNLTDDHKEKLSAILLQVPRHCIAQAANLVTENWIPKSSPKRQSFYNLAFLLLLETLFTFTSKLDVSEFTGFSIYLHKLDLEVQ